MLAPHPAPSIFYLWYLVLLVLYCTPLCRISGLFIVLALCGTPLLYGISQAGSRGSYLSNRMGVRDGHGRGDTSFAATLPLQ